MQDTLAALTVSTGTTAGVPLSDLAFFLTIDRLKPCSSIQTSLRKSSGERLVIQL